MNEREYLLFGILDLLLRHAESPCTALSLARDLGLTPTAVTVGLVHLEARGLVDADRVRLTLAGLGAARTLAVRPSESATRAA